MPRKPRNPRRRAQARSSNIDAELIPHLATQPYQKITTLKVPGLPTLVSCDANGDVASTYPLNGNRIDDVNRYRDIFDEFRLIKVVAELRPVASTATSGLTNFWIDENDVSSPSLEESQRKIGILLSNNGQTQSISRGSTRRLTPDQLGVQRIVWTARDLNDLIFDQTVNISTRTPACLKAFTDNSNYGTPAVAQPLFLVRFHFTYQFRGQTRG